MVSIDLKDAYLQIPVHPDSRQFLRFVVFGVPYQFKVPCFGLSTAPQVFTWVMAPVSAMLHRLRIWVRRYLEDWLALASSRANAVWARDMVLSLCRDLGQPGQVSPCSSSVCDLPRNVDCDSDFQGFPLSGEGFHPADIDRRVSVLQAARHRLLAQSARPPVVSVSAGSRGSSPDVIVTAGSPLRLGLRGRIGSGGVVSTEPGGSSLVV